VESALRGFLVGLTIAAAVGPISLLIIRRTLADGMLVGLSSGLGAATADGLYGAVAAFGLTAVSDLLVGQRRLLGVVGGLFLLVLAWRAATSRPMQAARGADAPATGLAGAYGSTVALTLTNPLTILSFVAIFAGLGIVGGSGLGAAALVAGVFLGSLLWWIVLTGGVSLLRSQVRPRVLRAVNLGSGALLAAFGVAAIWSGLVG
jgi:threonine/homoserine/homoserine lactone efflux protein